MAVRYKFVPLNGKLAECEAMLIHGLILLHKFGEEDFAEQSTKLDNMRTCLMQAIKLSKEIEE